MKSSAEMNCSGLNATFKQKSNAAFNNVLFSSQKISNMHEQMKRLNEAARLMKDITGPSELGRALNVSPQTIKNWESRGVSRQGMLDAQRLIGCSALWIETGQGSMLIAAQPAAQYIVQKAMQESSDALPLTPRQMALIGLFDGLTEGQQDEEIRRLEAQKQSNEAIVSELMKKRQA